MSEETTNSKTITPEDLISKMTSLQETIETTMANFQTQLDDLRNKPNEVTLIKEPKIEEKISSEDAWASLFK